MHEGRLTFALCDNLKTVFKPRTLALLVAASITAHICHPQIPTQKPAETPLTPTVSRRVEVLLRQKAQLPPGSTVTVGPATPSEFSGYKNIPVTVAVDGKISHPITFLISDDGKTLAQFIKYDISADPRTAVAFDGRPARGGPITAPVMIVGFDDLECPFCAQLYASIFPAITERYGDNVHIVYKDFPLVEIHPWAMHAAVDVNCLAEQSAAGYWRLVDIIHSHALDIGLDQSASVQMDASAAAVKTPDKATTPKKTLPRSIEQLDNLTRTEGKNSQVNLVTLNECIAKQDTTIVDAERQLAISLNVESTPTLFINGNKIDGAVPIAFIFGVIDDALRAEHLTPPPPYSSPKTPESNPPPNSGK